MKGTTKKVKICGEIVCLGDELVVKYGQGGWGQIKGTVIELWDGKNLQGRLSNNWCFHDYDKILSITKRRMNNANI